VLDGVHDAAEILKLTVSPETNAVPLVENVPLLVLM
jgi:hypothetical protein